jgi:hypothetical protein
VTRHVIRCLTGYDLATERLAFRRDIPDESWNKAKGIARLPAEAEIALASCPLSDAQAQKIAVLLGATLPSERMDYFLEPFATRSPDGHVVVRRV